MAYFLSKILILIVVIGVVYASLKTIQYLRHQNKENDKHYHK